jgi:hypothetical protein
MGREIIVFLVHSPSASLARHNRASHHDAVQLQRSRRHNMQFFQISKFQNFI